jgi:hypothetical protein
MGKCKNCKYWGKSYLDPKRKSCYKLCDDYQDESIEIDVEVYADDDQGLMCELITGPDFGCILFTSKVKD